MEKAHEAQAGINMFATTKALHVAHVIVTKVLTGKAVIATSILVGSISTGYLVQSGVPFVYSEHAALLVNNAAIAESPVFSADLTGAEARHAEAELEASIDPAVPHITVSSRRMTWRQRADYDASVHTAIDLSTK